MLVSILPASITVLEVESSRMSGLDAAFKIRYEKKDFLRS
jgi:hypothetical protein